MADFWKWHIRFRLARALIHLGLAIWPKSNSKREVVNILNEWSAAVVATNAINRATAARK